MTASVGSLHRDTNVWKEWLGGDPNSVQTNYFSKGDTSTYDRGATHAVSNSFEFHTYTIDWTQESITWSIDGGVVRTLTYEQAKGGTEYPQTPMQVKLGSWVGGRSDAPQGTVDWAGGLANFDNGPSHAYYRRVSVTDYAGGVEGAKQYIYSDRSGTWESIIIETGDGEVPAKGKAGDEEKDDESYSSVAPTPSATDGMTTSIRPSPSSTVEVGDGDEADTGDDGEGESTDNADDNTDNTGDEDSPDAPVQEDGGSETPASGATLSAQALTYVGVVISGAAMLGSVL